MKKLVLKFLGIVIVLSALFPSDLLGQRRRVVVVRRHPVVRARPIVHVRHPIRRVLPTTVVVRPARSEVVVGAPLVFLPPVAWSGSAASLPSNERFAWQDSEEIDRDEGWVDTNFGIDSSGNALFLQINGSTQLDFAEVAFANGNVQVVDFNDRTHGNGVYRLLDFADGRHVKTVRLLAKSNSEDTRLAVYLTR